MVADDELTPEDEAFLDGEIAHASAILDSERAAHERQLEAEVFGPDDALKTFIGDAEPKAIEDWGRGLGPNETQAEWVARAQHEVFGDEGERERLDQHEDRLLMLENPDPEPELLPEVPWRWATLTEDWTAGQNTIESNPCLEAGAAPDADTTLTLYCTLPLASTPDFVNLSEDDVVAYLPFYDSVNEAMRGIIVGTPQMPDGAAGDILYSDGTSWQKLTFADADYKVLQRKADDSMGWDYVRAT